jgi:glycosyltransferase involved in cell wall biosynthesis
VGEIERVALVHDWLTGMRGGEKVLEVLAEIFPQADLYTLFHLPGSVSPALESLPIRTSFLQHAPFLRRSYRHYLPLFPRAIASFDLGGYDWVISSSHCVAKGVRARAGRHLCYCHTPMRYVWDRFDDYFGAGQAGRLRRAAARPFAARLRAWDRRTAAGVDRFIASSAHVAGRIRAYYDRPSIVLRPPVDTRLFQLGGPGRGDGYLVVAALVPYKRVDVAVRAFARSGRRLRIAGDGPERPRLERLAGPEVTFLGRIDDAALAAEYRRCRALVVPGVEDAGITPLEAMASGRPVIALDRGGVPEVVVSAGGPEPATGVLHSGDRPEALRASIDQFERMEAGFDPAAIRRHAERFDRAVFKSRVAALLREARQQPEVRAVAQ